MKTDLLYTESHHTAFSCSQIETPVDEHSPHLSTAYYNNTAAATSLEMEAVQNLINFAYLHSLEHKHSHFS